VLVAAATVVNWSSSFLVTFTFSDMQKSFGTSGIFFFYCGVLVAGGVLIYLAVPETRGLSESQVTAMFRALRNNNKSASSGERSNFSHPSRAPLLDGSSM
jgi:hypothetical protein